MNGKFKISGRIITADFDGILAWKRCINGVWYGFIMDKVGQKTATYRFPQGVNGPMMFAHMLTW